MSYFKYKTERQYSMPSQSQVLYCFKERTENYCEIFDQYEYHVYFNDIDRSIVGMVTLWGDDCIDDLLTKYDAGQYEQLSNHNSWIMAINSKFNLGV